MNKFDYRVRQILEGSVKMKHETPDSEAGLDNSEVGSEFFQDPDSFYRIVNGDDAFNDIVKTGAVKAFTPDTSNMTPLQKIKVRPTSFPSFSKGKADTSYATDANHYIIVTKDASIMPALGRQGGQTGRHGKGSTHFPTGPTGNPLNQLPGSQVSVYKSNQNGKYSLVYANGKLINNENILR